MAREPEGGHATAAWRRGACRRGQRVDGEATGRCRVVSRRGVSVVPAFLGVTRSRVMCLPCLAGWTHSLSHLSAQYLDSITYTLPVARVGRVGRLRLAAPAPAPLLSLLSLFLSLSLSLSSPPFLLHDTTLPPPRARPPRPARRQHNTTPSPQTGTAIQTLPRRRPIPRQQSRPDRRHRTRDVPASTA